MKIKFSELFDVNNDFDLIMMKVFAAYDDLKNSLDSMEVYDLKANHRIWIAKMQIALMRECYMLISKKLFSEPHISDIKKFENYDEIDAKYLEVKKKRRIDTIGTNANSTLYVSL